MNAYTIEKVGFRTMPKCERLDACPFFNDQMAYTPFLASLVKKQYCLGEPERCARLIVLKAKGAEGVPEDLFPTQADRVPKILGE